MLPDFMSIFFNFIFSVNFSFFYIFIIMTKLTDYFIEHLCPFFGDL